METKKIGINLLCYNNRNLAGTWFFFKRIVEALPTLQNAEFIFYCQDGFELEKHVRIPSGVRYRCLNSSLCSSRSLRVLYEQLLLPFKARGLDVLFSPCVANPVFHPWCRTITTIHDLTPFFVKNKYGFLQGKYVQLITRLLAATSDRVVTVSENSKLDLAKWFENSEAKTYVVHNFVPAKDLSVISYDNFFLCVGTLQPAKNLAGVIRSFAIFSQNYDKDNHRLIIVGANGWGQNGYSRLIQELGMESRIEFASYISEQDLNALYSRCKGLILMSLYEGFGIPPLEALSWNKPSIVSDRSSLPEVVGRTGIRVDPMDSEQAALAIKAIADDPQKFLGGREEQMAKFSPKTQVEKFLAVLGVK